MVLSWQGRDPLFVDVIKMQHSRWHCNTWDDYSHLCDVINLSLWPEMLWRAARRAGFWWITMVGLYAQQLICQPNTPVRGQLINYLRNIGKCLFHLKRRQLLQTDTTQPCLHLFNQSRPWLPPADLTHPGWDFRWLGEVGMHGGEIPSAVSTARQGKPRPC